jgi:parallel beta-helix repeat protein
MELWAPDGVIANNICYDNDGTGLSVGGKNSVVRGNYCFNNGAGVGGFGIWARWQSDTYNASGSIFIGNTATDTRYPASTMTQTYGYKEQSGGLMRIRHTGNDYSGNKVGPTSYNSLYGQPNVPEIQGSHTIRMGISSATKNKIKALPDTKDIAMSDSARRALREYLDREEKAQRLNDEPAEYPKKKKR